MKKTWLISFNLVTALAWLLFLAHVALHGFSFDKQGGLMLALAQGLAVFEIINAIAGIAGASWLLTSLQVFSRFIVVGLLLWLPTQLVVAQGHYSGYSVVAVAWGITEIIRALYYLVGLFGKEVKLVTWMRYTFFIFLYPMGVLGEFMVMFTFFKWRSFEVNMINAGLLCVAISYLVFFPKLYWHMIKQRKKKVN